jgi:hypothetical protein
MSQSGVFNILMFYNFVISFFFRFSTISKVKTGADTKEELKLNTFTYHVDASEPKSGILRYFNMD